MSTQRFFILFLVFNLVLAILPATAGKYSEFRLIPGFWGLFVVFDILTLNICLIARWRMQIGHKASGQVLLGTITARFLFCMVLVLIYVVKIPVKPVPFLACFFYLYFFHFIFEVYCLLRNLRNQKIT
ncbi:hypothetical protein [Hufsiella ginkgonis]|uniref:Uncharacterized protein n=1 Tax=Hufsiella ginkgonis TaxID=2695274 RepID=A0A7K1Y3H1_9SPHI|nr:hypothetical protein [Hufsiella ginkgonis]MXV17589.1 hypothetical protein [Hufsiella ginkgonis]